MRQSQILNNHYLKPLLAYMVDKEHITPWLRSRIRAAHSRKADENHDKSARSFCFVIIGDDHVIHYASSLVALPVKFVIGILLHEIAHMVIEEDGDPELGVDEWVLENVPDSGYEYKNIRYEDFDGKTKTAKNLECVSEKFLKLIGV